MQKEEEKINGAVNDNENVTNEFYLDWLRDIKKGNFKAYLGLGRAYEFGYGVLPNTEKALKAYENYYNEYRRVVPRRFNIIEFLISIGTKYQSLGNNYKAAEWFLKAYTHILEEYNDEKQQQKAFRKYKLEKLLKETGCHNVV